MNSRKLVPALLAAILASPAAAQMREPATTVIRGDVRIAVKDDRPSSQAPSDRQSGRLGCPHHAHNVGIDAPPKTLITAVAFEVGARTTVGTISAIGNAPRR